MVRTRPTAHTSPGILRGLGNQVEGPVGHDDVNPVLLAGVVDDLSAGTAKADQGHAILDDS